MKNIIKGVSVGFGAYLIALIYTAPVHLITPYLPAEIQLFDAEGTIWNGAAGHLQVQQFEFGKVTWHVNPFYLVLGRAKADFNFNQTLLKGHGDITIKLHSLGLENLHIAGKTSFINPFINDYGTSLDGRVELTLNSFWAHQSGPEQADGLIVLQDVQLLTPTALTLGDIEIKLEQRDEIAAATLKNNSDMLSLNGIANIEPGWQYTTNLTIAPTPSTPNDLKRSLALLGRTNTRGAVTLTNRGRIPILEWLPHLQQSNEET